MKATRNKRLSLPRLAMLLLAVMLLGGCSSGDVEQMEAGLIKSGMTDEQAKCFAQAMSKTVDAGPYNFMAKLMLSGVDEKTAVTRARRKYGAEFKAPMTTAREACVE